MSIDLETSWRRAWRGIGARSDGDALVAALKLAYREPQRRYHTLQHLGECIDLFDRVGAVAAHPAEVEVGLWFHDAVYDPKRSDNEARSADWLDEAARADGVAADVAQRIRALVMATRHAALPDGIDEGLLVDIDLAILAAGAERFAEYERQIRAEYAFVPDPTFTAQRRAILAAFLGRERIYGTPRLHDELEPRARANLGAAIAALREPPVANGVRGSRGYAEQVDELVAKYEAIDFTTKHAAVLPLLPPAPASVLDIGAGTGADAAWLAANGYRVVAVEPTAALRSRAIALHPSAAIEWIDDSLPALCHVLARRRRFDLVMLTAVWMHLDAAERRLAMVAVAALVANDGLLVITLRHGPVPSGRIMFSVSAEETIALAGEHRLVAVLDIEAPAIQASNRDAGVSFSQLVFRRRKAGEDLVDATSTSRATP